MEEKESYGDVVLEFIDSFQESAQHFSYKNDSKKSKDEIVSATICAKSGF